MNNVPDCTYLGSIVLCNLVLKLGVGTMGATRSCQSHAIVWRFVGVECNIALPSIIQLGL